MISGCHMVHVGAHRFNDVRAFVSQHTRRAGRQRTRGLRQVGMAHTTGGDPYPHLIGRQVGQRDLFDLQRFADRPQDCTAFRHRHCLPLAGPARPLAARPRNGLERTAARRSAIAPL